MGQGVFFQDEGMSRSLFEKRTITGNDFRSYGNLLVLKSVDGLKSPPSAASPLLLEDGTGNIGFGGSKYDQ